MLSALDRTMEALHHQDIELASIVILDDDRLDGRYLEVHQGILSLLALQAPVASDLRTVAALLHVIKHAERMGDQCVNIAKMLPLSGHEPPVDEQILERIEQMGRLVRSEVEQAKQAFSLRDVGLAEDLVRQDERVNALNRECFKRAVEIGTDSDTREWAMSMMLVSRALERDRRQRGGHRRAGRVRRHRAVPGVLGRLPPHASRESAVCGRARVTCDQGVTVGAGA